MDYLNFLRTENRVLTNDELMKLNERLDVLNNIESDSQDVMNVVYTESELISLVIMKSLQRMGA